jgi:hypothetical protein
MPLPTSGPIKMSDIKAALSTTSNSLRQYNVIAKAATGLVKFDIPDVMSEFYGYSGTPTPTPVVPTYTPIYTPEVPTTPTYYPPTAPTPTTPETQIIISIAASDAQSACDGGDYGNITVTVYGTTLCDATKILDLPFVVTNDLGDTSPFYAAWTDGNGTRYTRRFRRDGQGTISASPTAACAVCTVTPTPIVPTYTPPTTPTYYPPAVPTPTVPTPTYIAPITFDVSIDCGGGGYDGGGRIIITNIAGGNSSNYKVGYSIQSGPPSSYATTSTGGYNYYTFTGVANNAGGYNVYVYNTDTGAGLSKGTGEIYCYTAPTPTPDYVPPTPDYVPPTPTPDYTPPPASWNYNIAIAMGDPGSDGSACTNAQYGSFWGTVYSNQWSQLISGRYYYNFDGSPFNDSGIFSDGVTYGYFSGGQFFAGGVCNTL